MRNGIRTNFIFASLLLVLFLMGTRGVTASTPAGDSNPTIYLHARTFTPTPGNDLPASTGQPRHGLIQFYALPGRAELAALQQAQVTLLTYIPNNTWLAVLPGSSESVANLPFVRWLGPLTQADKLDNFLRQGQIPAWARSGDGQVLLWLRGHADQPLSTLANLVTSQGGTITAQSPEFTRLSVTVPAGAINQLAADDAVAWLAIAPPPPSTLNQNSRTNSGAALVQVAPYNLSGAGVQVAMWDDGLVDPTHPDFAGRLTLPFTDTVASHATHVAGTLVGSGANSLGHQLQGYAPGAALIAYDWSVPVSVHNQAINDFSADVSHNSWGFNVCSLFGMYAFGAPDYDQITGGLYGRGIPVIFAAGNSRGLCSRTYGTVLGGGQSAKNVLTVGAILSNSDELLSTSAWGPTLDGRLKPELVAPGSATWGGIMSTLPGGTYGAGSGTSMAAPAVSGAAALLLERYHQACPAGGDAEGNPQPATLRALLLHTATDLAHDDNPALNPGPDFASGYGKLNVAAAVDMLPSHVTGVVAPAGVAHYTLAVPAGQPLKVTLAWDDPAGADSAAIALVNNLDLTLIAPDGTLYGPWLLNAAPGHESDPATRPVNQPELTDNRNVAEQVVVDTPAAGLWTVEVRGTSLPAGAQPFTLVSDLLVENGQPLSGCQGATATNLWLDSGVGESGPMLTSADVWVQASPINNETHQNPEYGAPNYIFVRVHNSGAAAQQVQVWLYGAPPLSSPAWPADVQLIGKVTLNNLPAGATQVAGPIVWAPPAPAGPDGTDYLLFARLVSVQDPLTEGADLLANVQANDGLAGKTVLVVDKLPNDPTHIQLRGLQITPAGAARLPAMLLALALLLPVPSGWLLRRARRPRSG